MILAFRFFIVCITLLAFETEATTSYTLPVKKSALLLSLLAEYGQPGGSEIKTKRALEKLDELIVLMGLDRVEDPAATMPNRRPTILNSSDAGFEIRQFEQEGETRFYWQQANDESFGLETQTVLKGDELFVTFTFLRSNRIPLTDAKRNRTDSDLFTGISRMTDALPRWARREFIDGLFKADVLDPKNRRVKWKPIMLDEDRLVRLELPRLKWTALTGPDPGSTIFDKLYDLFVVRLTYRGDCSRHFIGLDIDPASN